MQFGVCGGPDLARIAKTAGFDYFEWSVGGLLHPREDETIFTQAFEEAKATGLPCPAVNVFIPADLKLTGPEVNRAALERYVNIAMRRANMAGIDVIVFGSGAARRIPDDFNRSHAWRQLVEFGKMVASIGEQYAVTVVVEPLNQGETNVINTVEEGASLVRDVDQHHLRLLVDGYHWAKDNDTPSGILSNARLLSHAHIATVDGRRPPRPGDNCALFLQTLKQSGYTGRISIEGNIEDPEIELPQALEVMRALAG